MDIKELVNRKENVNYREVCYLSELIQEHCMKNIKESMTIALEVLSIDSNKITID